MSFPEFRPSASHWSDIESRWDVTPSSLPSAEYPKEALDWAIADVKKTNPESAVTNPLTVKILVKST